MAFTEKCLGQAQISSVGNTTLYTVPGATVGIVRDIHICNTTALAATITIWIDPDGVVADDTTAVIKIWSVPAREFLHWTGFIPMEAGAQIQAIAGTATAITVTVSGAEIT